MNLRYLRIHGAATPPSRAYKNSAAWDLSACLYTKEGHPYTITIPPNSTRSIPTGLVLLPPPEHYILICSRSGMAIRSIFIANAPGVIDPDYTGEIKALLYNGGMEPQYVKNGDRVAQAILIHQPQCELEEAHEAPKETERGSKGFGSTGS